MIQLHVDTAHISYIGSLPHQASDSPCLQHAGFGEGAEGIGSCL